MEKPAVSDEQIPIPSTPDRPPRRSRARWVIAILVVAALGAFAYVSRPAAAPAGWQEDFTAARQIAESTQRPMLLAFGMTYCPPCNQMKREVLPSDEVREALADFVPVALDVYESPEIATRYQVDGTPTYVVTTPEGEELARTSGYHKIDKFVAFLRTATQ
jgi:thioredoxin-related protein